MLGGVEDHHAVHVVIGDKEFLSVRCEDHPNAHSVSRNGLNDLVIFEADNGDIFGVVVGHVGKALIGTQCDGPLSSSCSEFEFEFSAFDVEHQELAAAVCREIHRLAVFGLGKVTGISGQSFDRLDDLEVRYREDVDAISDEARDPGFFAVFCEDDTPWDRTDTYIADAFVCLSIDQRDGATFPVTDDGPPTVRAERDTFGFASCPDLVKELVCFCVVHVDTSLVEDGDPGFFSVVCVDDFNGGAFVTQADYSFGGEFLCVDDRDT